MRLNVWQARWSLFFLISISPSLTDPVLRISSQTHWTAKTPSLSNVQDHHPVPCSLLSNLGDVVSHPWSSTGWTWPRNWNPWPPPMFKLEKELIKSTGPRPQNLRYPWANHTISFLWWWFWWKSLSEDVCEYVSTCSICTQNKSTNLHRQDYSEQAHNLMISFVTHLSPFELTLGNQPLVFPAIEVELTVPFSS